MSFDKAIEHKKEHRKQYRGAKLVDSFCRNHGSCSWCSENRTYKNLKRIEKAKSKENEEKHREDINGNIHSNKHYWQPILKEMINR